MCPIKELFLKYKIMCKGTVLMENNASCKIDCIETVIIKIFGRGTYT